MLHRGHVRAGVRPDMIWLALLYIPANFMYQIGENALASFLSDVATSRNVGASARRAGRWGTSARCLLALTFAAMLLFGLKAVELEAFFCSPASGSSWG